MSIAFPAIGMLHSSQNATDMPHFYNFVLKGIPSKDAGWLKNVENVWIFPVAGFVCLCVFVFIYYYYFLINIYATEEILICFKFELPRMYSCSQAGPLFASEERKWLPHDVMDTLPHVLVSS